MLPLGAMPMVPVQARAGVGQDVAEQIGADHDVKPVGMQHEVRSQDIDVELVSLLIGIFFRHRLVSSTALRNRSRFCDGRIN
jgi:hypothetical protein